jgi:hypothetical protein
LISLQLPLNSHTPFLFLATDEGGVLGGERVRIPLYLMDALDPTQQAIALSRMQLSDGLGNAAGHRPGFVFSDAIDHRRLAEHRDFAKAELSARYRGGLQQGDRVQLGDRAMTVVGRNSENGKVRLSEVEHAQDAAAERIAAYDAYNADLTSAWQRDEDLAPGDDCIVNGEPGRICREGDQLVCRPLRQSARASFAGSEDRKVVQRDPMGRQKSSFEGPDDNEWALGGPLSDGQNVKEAAYQSYEQNLRDAWRGE